MKIYITSRGNVAIVISTMVVVQNKFMQFGIFVFVEAQEINLRGNLQVSKCDRDCIFYEDIFVLRKSSFHSLPFRFFRNILIRISGDVLN